MSKAGKRLISGLESALKFSRLKAKADELLALGDAAAREGRGAESRRLLRECRRYRKEAAKYGKIVRVAPSPPDVLKE